MRQGLLEIFAVAVTGVTFISSIGNNLPINIGPSFVLESKDPVKGRISRKLDGAGVPVDKKTVVRNREGKTFYKLKNDQFFPDRVGERDLIARFKACTYADKKINMPKMKTPIVPHEQQRRIKCFKGNVRGVS